jgi:hypothetical protein
MERARYDICMDDYDLNHVCFVGMNDDATRWLGGYASQHGLAVDWFGGVIVDWEAARQLIEAIQQTQFKLTTWAWQVLMALGQERRLLGRYGAVRG